MIKSEGIAFTVWLAKYYEIDLGSNLSIIKLTEAWDNNMTPEELKKERVGNVRKDHIR